MKIAFVIQRYGLEVNGGAELLCRLIAEHLSKHFDIDIITTCAKDYMTWRNEYAPGKDEINRVTVWRFPVDEERDPIKFGEYNDRIFEIRHKRVNELKWMSLQGPKSTKLLDFIKLNKNNYNYFIFVTYIYYTTFNGLPLVKDKAILIPNAHNEPYIYLSIFRSLFRSPKAIIYNTLEEKLFVTSKFKNCNITNDIIGVGIDPPPIIEPEDFKQKYNINNFIIYVGRIDGSKGCQELFEYFQRYKKETKSEIKLVLLGKNVMKIPEDPDIIHLGFVSEQDKFNGIKAAELMIMPSRYESLSMAIMEAWICNKAVLVNGNCDVLREQCRKSNGGLYYNNYKTFRDSLNRLLRDSPLSAQMGTNGRRYVEKNYSWSNIENKYFKLFKLLENKNNIKNDGLFYQLKVIMMKFRRKILV